MESTVERLYFVAAENRQGQILSASELDSVRNMERALPLARLLLARDFPYQLGDFETIGMNQWDADKGKVVGEEISDDLATVPEQPAFTKEMVRRLHVLGVFPDFNYIRRHFGTHLEFVKSIEAKPSWDYSRYDNMSPLELIKSITDSYRSTGLKGPISFESLVQLHKFGMAPSRKYLLNRNCSLTLINETLGYPNVRKWDDDMHLEYGATVLRLNGHGSLTKENADLLSKHRFGPSSASMARKFGSWSAFVRHAAKELSIEDAELKNPGRRIRHISKPQGSARQRRIAHGRRSQYIALNIILEHYLPGYKVDVPNMKVLNVSTVLLSTIRQVHPNVTATEIESTAASLDIFDALWPTELSFSIRPPIIEDCRARR
jgi:hypothetical protein